MDLSENVECQFSDEDNEFGSCETCGSDTHWESCYNCGGEGGVSGEDLMMEDPFFYDKYDFRICHVCEGKGGWYVCLNLKGHYKRAIYIGKEFEISDWNGKEVDVDDDYTEQNAPCYKIRIDNEWIGNIHDCDLRFL